MQNKEANISLALLDEIFILALLKVRLPFPDNVRDIASMLFSEFLATSLELDLILSARQNYHKNVST